MKRRYSGSVWDFLLGRGHRLIADPIKPNFTTRVWRDSQVGGAWRPAPLNSYRTGQANMGSDAKRRRDQNSRTALHGLS
jgi:hypothetical protein